MTQDVDVQKSIRVIKKGLKKWTCGVTFSGGKDSLVLLHLVAGQKPDIPVIFNDTGVKFKESYAFIDRIRNEWGLENFHVAKASKPWSEEEWSLDKVGCCYRLKVEPFNKAISELGLDAVFVGIRGDEHPARSKAKYYDKMGGVTHIDRVEFNHMRIHPLLHWAEEAIWSYIRDRELPYNPLYDRGYRSIGCEPCTAPSSETERSGREQDKELVLDRLRELGYF